MSMEIKIDRGINQTIYYSGVVSFPERTDHAEWRFTVSVHYFENLAYPTVDVMFEDILKTFNVGQCKAERRIIELVMELEDKENRK